MHIKVSTLKEGTHNYQLDEPIESVGLEAPFFGKVNLVLALHKQHNQIILETNLNVKANFDCDRCNTSYEVLLFADYRMVYLFGKISEQNEDTLNVVHLPIDASEIVLDNDVRDYAMLAIPMRKLCKDDCKGLCVSCGKNLNEGQCSCKNESMDERWMPLQNIKKRIDNN